MGEAQRLRDQKLQNVDVNALEDLEAIVSPKNSLNYDLSTLLTMALAQKLGDNGDLISGAEKLIGSVVEKAKDVRDGHAEQFQSPLELFNSLDDDLKTDEGKRDLVERMKTIKAEYIAQPNP